MDETRIALEVLITEREGMIAENAMRARSNHPGGYGGEAFHALADQMRSFGKGGQEIGGPGSLPGTVYLVIQRQKVDPNAGSDIIGAFAVAEDGYGWIKRQHDLEAYFLEPLKVIGEGGGQ